MSGEPWIGVDLDGTLAHYDGWVSVDHIGEPIPPMVMRVRGWLAQGIKVRIFTARVSDMADAPIAREAIQRWTKKYIGEELLAVCCKDYDMIELWDDRAVGVVKNTGRIFGELPVGERTP